jgi:hypothetical protein
MLAACWHACASPNGYDGNGYTHVRALMQFDCCDVGCRAFEHSAGYVGSMCVLETAPKCRHTAPPSLLLAC